METTTLLTAYNQDVQIYIENGNKQIKKEIIQELKEDALQNGINFNRLFPSGSKRLKVLDEIIFMLSGGGICKISRNKLAENTGSSIRLVSDVVKGIKQLDLIIVGGLADGKNKYIFVYKNHTDYQEILKNVFYVNEIKEAPEATNAHQIAQQIAQQENAESVDMTATDGDKLGSNNDNSTIFRHDKDIIRQSIENDVKQSVNQDARIEDYVSNPYQKLLYENIISNKHINVRIKEDASVIALRAGSNCNEKMFNIARVAVEKVDKFLYFGGVAESVPAVFEKIYTDRLKYSYYYKAKAPEPVEKRDTSYLFNWLKG